MQLALETSTKICSVVLKDAAGDLHESRTESRGSHSEQLFLFIEELKREYEFEISDLDSVIVSEGPGSYTGLRISASAVKGLLFGQDISLLSANTLASFAASAFSYNSELTTVHSIIDARRVHLYHQKFLINENSLLAEDQVQVIPIEEFQEMIEQGDCVVGTGFNRIDTGILENAMVLKEKHISAASLFTLLDLDRSGKFVKKVDPRQFEPKYYTSNQVYKKSN